MSKMISGKVLEELCAAVPGRVRTGDEIREDYVRDEMPIYGTAMPDAVVECAATEEVAAVCKICYDNNIPIIPRGAGTGLTGGCVAHSGGVIIDTTRMNRILSYDLENFTVRVQAGVLLSDLAEDCLNKGVLYPPDPGEKFATIGGNAATNAGGMRAVKYGSTRDYVRAMTVVLPCGEIIRLGGEVSKTSTGYSLLQLMIGSEGTLGIITELSLKVVPQPKQTFSLLALFPDLDTAISCVPKVKMAGLDPQALEFMGREIVVSIERYLERTVYPGESDGTPVGAYLLTTFECESEESMETVMEQAAEVFLENDALDVIVYDTPEAMRSAWTVRGACLESILTEFSLTDECDVVVPIPKIAEFVNYAKELGGELGVTVRASGHAGDGNVHVNVCANDMDRDEFMALADKFMKQLYAKGLSMGGLISGEHGIGYAKRTYLDEAMGETVMGLMRGVKRVFDPKGLLNPGKVCGTDRK